MLLWLANEGKGGVVKSNEVVEGGPLVKKYAAFSERGDEEDV